MRDAEKQQSPEVARGQTKRPSSRTMRRLKLYAALATICLSVWVLYDRFSSFRLPIRTYHEALAPLTVIESNRTSELAETYHRPVALEAHIMSKCPDARDCLTNLVVPTMEKVNSIVDFQLSFIGAYVAITRGVHFRVLLRLLIVWTKSKEV